MLPNDPRHGTYAGAQTHWRENETTCPTCRASVRRYQKRRKYDIHSGNTRKVDTAPICAHIHQLAEQGMTDGAIAARAGVSITCVREARISRRTRMLQATADAILGVTLDPYPQGAVDETGTRRRLQALAALGWPRNAIVEAATKRGHTISQGVVAWIVQNRSAEGHVRVATRDAIAAAYGELSMRLPEPGRSTTQTRAHATAKGYLPPLAWSENIDDPKSRPDTGRYRSQPTNHDYDENVVLRILEGDYRLQATTAERREVVRRWRKSDPMAGHRGYSREDPDKPSMAYLARLTGWKTERYIDREDGAA